MVKTKSKREVKTNYRGVSTLEVLEEAKNYNRWIAHEILTHVTQPTLELGAGIGNLTQFFLNCTPLYITDNDSGLVSKLQKRFEGENNVIIQKLDILDKPAKKFISFFSTIYAINVLEHIERDKIALKHIYTMLKPGGKVLLLVPAKKFAYTKLDQELGHFRRYEKKELEDKLKKNGFVIETIYYFNIIGLISWYFRDKAYHNKDINLKPYHIAIFDSIVPFLRFFESKIRVPAGISLIVVARKV